MVVMQLKVYTIQHMWLQGSVRLRHEFIANWLLPWRWRQWCWHEAVDWCKFACKLFTHLCCVQNSHTVMLKLLLLFGEKGNLNQNTSLSQVCEYIYFYFCDASTYAYFSIYVICSGVVAIFIWRNAFPSFPFPSFWSRPLFEARGSGGALKLPQRVRAEPGYKTQFAAFWAKIKASGGNNFSDFPDNQLINSSVLRWF